MSDHNDELRRRTVLNSEEGNGKKKEKENKESDSDIQYESNAKEAFLQHANLLETINEEMAMRKRKTGKKKKIMPNISLIPKYRTGNILREKNFERMMNTNKKKIKTKESEQKKRENEGLRWFGDPLTMSKEWPSTTDIDSMRIFHINHNGITYNNEYLEWEMSIAYMMDMQVDIFGITEANLDFHNKKVKDDFIQRGQFFDSYMKMAVSSSLQTVGQSPFKMGGTVTGVNGCWSGRIERKGSDKLGRWSYVSLRTKKCKLINVITFYLPGKPSKNKGESTIYSQMELDVLQQKRRLSDPRKELLKDLKTFINKEHEKGNKNILMGDANDNVGKATSDIRKFLDEVEMEPTYYVRHGNDAILPATHDRGTTCIDFIATTIGLPDGTIKKAGYAPFYTNIYTDHRGIYVDLDTTKLFNSTRPDTTRSIYKRFTTQQIPKCNRYLKKLEELLEGAKMFKLIDTLESELREMVEGKKEGEVKQKLVNRCKILFEKVSQLMLCSERRSGPVPYRDGFPDSPKLREAAFKVVRLKKYLRLVSLGSLEGGEQEREKVEKDLKSSLLQLREAQSSSHMLRQEFLGDLAEKRATQWKMSATEALEIIKESEKSKKMHRKHRRFMKPGNMGTLRSLMIPAPITGKVNNIKDPDTYMEISDSKVMFDILLRKNFDHLLLSKSSMFSRGPLLDKCGWYGEQNGIQEILTGMMDCEEMGKHYPEFGLEGVEFLKALKYETNEDGTRIKPFQWSFGIEEYKDVFNHTKESTACGPSGLHMSHWKAACERDRIARIHAFFIWAAFQFGFTYARWENSWHCMIQKMQQPLLPKLRIVQLFEGDFNAGLKYLIGRKMMRHLNDNGTHDPETYGSRSGKTAPEAILNLQVLFDHCRLWEKPVGCIFNDAVGCYDRIVPTLCETTMIRKGCPPGIAKCHTLTQKNMSHRIRISTGISEGTIKFSKETLIKTANNHITSIQGKTGGIGQGGGGGPMAWISVIIVMIETYRKLCTGATITDVRNIDPLLNWIVSYVDDNTLVQTFGKEKNTTEMIKKMTENLGCWQRLLQITGGDIDLEKSQWSMLSWTYEGQWGTPKLNTKKTMQGDLCLSSPINSTKAIEKLHRLEPHEADRVLGVRLPMDGTMEVEYKFRLKQMATFANRLRNAPLSHYDAYIVYECRYQAMIRYPLAVTYFSPKQCDRLQRSVIHTLLPKIGLNRNMPRAVIFGPLALGGREIMDLRLEQITSQWESTKGHLCREDRAGRGLKLTMHDHQCIIGSATLFLNIDPDLYDYGEKNTRWKFIWKSLWNNGLSADVYDYWLPTCRGINDKNIMDTAVRDKTLTGSKWNMLHHINRCRIYLKVFHLSDLTEDGITIDKGYLNGDKVRNEEILVIPDITKPTDAQWRVWKSFLFRNFLSPGTTINPSIGNNVNNITRDPSRKPSEINSIIQLYGTEGTLTEILESFPSELQPMIGSVEIPEDGGLALSHSIVEGECLGASDGSLMRTFYEVRGGFGYVLSNRTNDQGSIEGIGVSPSMDDMSSQTTEHQGLLGLLCLLHAMCIKFLLCKEECWGEITIFIDNKNVVSRAGREQEIYNISDYQVPDQDLWAMTTMLIKALPISIKCKWVKGHSDTNEKGEIIHGPFWRSTQLNIWTDRLATEGLKRSERYKILKPVFSTTKIQLRNDEGITVTNVRRYLLRQNNGEILLDYYRQRKGWHSRVLSQVDWEALEALLKKAHPIKKNRIVQVLHDWQNVGSQKGRFRDARLGSKVEPPLQPTVEEESTHKCPMECGETEDNLHYVKCQATSAIKARDKMRKNLLGRLRKLKTSDFIISFMGYLIKSISNREEVCLDDITYSTVDERDLIPALIGQEEIGWEELLKGFAHKGWAQAQMKHYRRNGLNSRIFCEKRWKRMFLTIITDYSNECWKLRNEMIHGNATEDGKKKTKQRLIDQVKELYGKQSEVRGSPYFKIFNMTLDRRVRQGVHSLRLWVGKAEEVLKLHREEADKNTMHRWLRYRQGDPHHP